MYGVCSYVDKLESSVIDGIFHLEQRRNGVNGVVIRAVWLSLGRVRKCKQDAKTMTLEQNSCVHTPIEINVLTYVRAQSLLSFKTLLLN